MKTSANFALGHNPRRLSIADYQRCADKYKIEVALVQSVTKVEAGTTGFWNSGNMKLLYEGHIAYRETSGELRDRLVQAGLAWENWGDVSYGKASQSRDRLRRAIAIAGPRAYRWASYGLGQIMGFNAESCGYSSARSMFETFLSGEPAQLDGMMRFIRANGLLGALRNKDWHKFARGYNGSAYASHNYHGRLEKAYLTFAGSRPFMETQDDGILTIGDKGQAVEELQARLVELGADIEVDGHFGRATAQAVEEVQKKLGLAVDGIVGPKTAAALKPKKSVVAPAVVAAGTGAGILVWAWDWISNLFI